MKKRHDVLVLNDIAAGGGQTDEANLSSFSYAWVYGKTLAGGNSTITVEAAPQEDGITPVWYLFGKSIVVTPSTNFVCPLPLGIGSDYMTPARIRVSSTGALQGVYVEGVRDLS